MADNKLQIRIAASDEASGAFDKIQRKMTDLNNQVDKTSRRFTEMNSVITSMAGAISLVGVAALTKDLLQAGMQLDQLNRQFAVFAGSADLGAREMEFVKEAANKLGLDMVGLSGSYGRFMNAVKGTANEGQKARDAFVGISEGMAATGMSAVNQERAWAQLNQGIMKGKFEMEDLKTINEAGLPVFKLMADALGITTKELLDMQKKGTLLVEDVLPKLGASMHSTFGVAATEGAKSAAAELARFNNAMFEAKSVAGTALLPVFTDIVKFITPAISKIQEATVAVQILGIKLAANSQKRETFWDNLFSGRGVFSAEGLARQKKAAGIADSLAKESIDSLMEKNFGKKNSDYTAAEKATQALRSKMQAGTQAGAATESASRKAAAALEKERKEAEHLEAALDRIREKLSKRLSLETGALESSASFGATAFSSQELQIPKDKQPFRSTVRLSNTGREDGALNYSRYSLTGSGSGLDPSRWDQSADELKKAEEQKAELLQIEERYNQQMLSSKMQFAEQSLALLAESSAEGSAIQIAAMVAMKALAIAQIIMNAHAASSAALLPPPVGLGPIAGQGMAASILAMGYANAAITGAVGIMSVANSVAGKRESGGPVVAGQSYLVGEKRPEIFTPNQSGWITPRADGAGGGVTQNITIDARGADAGVLARIDAAMKKAREDAKTDIMNSLNRGGAYSRAVGRA